MYLISYLRVVIYVLRLSVGRDHPQSTLTEFLPTQGLFLVCNTEKNLQNTSPPPTTFNLIGLEKNINILMLHDCPIDIQSSFMWKVWMIAHSRLEQWTNRKV